MWIILAFVVGIIFGVFLEWSAWTRCRRQHTKVGTPSASHNTASLRFCWQCAKMMSCTCACNAPVTCPAWEYKPAKQQA